MTSSKNITWCAKYLSGNPRQYLMIKPDYQNDTFPHWTTITIRFRDLDPLNHVNNAIFSTYYEEARIDFIRQIPQLTNQLKNGFSFVLANIDISFMNPIEYPTDIIIGSGIKSLGNSSIMSFQAIYSAEDKTLASVAEAHGVWFDLSKQRPTRIPDIPKKDQYFFPDGFFE